jgi:hypothetical protein
MFNINLVFTIINLIIILFVFCIPISIIIFVVRYFKKQNKLNDCSNCPYSKDNNPDIEK